MPRFRFPPGPGHAQTDSMDALPLGDSGHVLAPRVVLDRSSAGCPREPGIRYANWLVMTLLATVPSVFLSAWLVSTLFGAYALISAQGDAAIAMALWMPVMALGIAGIAFLFGILPALLVCAPLWALLQRLGMGGYIAFAVVGSLPGAGLLVVDGSSLGSLFLIFGLPASLLVRVFVSSAESASRTRKCTAEGKEHSP